MNKKIYVEIEVIDIDIRMVIPKRKGKEVQLHGLIWEYEMKLNIYRATIEELKEIKSTSKMDLPSKFNRLDACDVSIKATCNKNAVCMADCLRVYDAVKSGNPFHMTVIHYKHNDDTNTKNILSITEIDLTNSCELLFGSLTRDKIEFLDKTIKSVPQKRKPTKEERQNIFSLRDSLQCLSKAIYLDPKCNSTQSRLQCSFNRFQKFIEENPTRIISKSNTNEFRGGVISSSIESSRRILKKRNVSFC